MRIQRKAWDNYTGQIERAMNKAQSVVKAHINKYGIPTNYAQRKALIDKAAQAASKYGEAAASAAAEMYDALAITQGRTIRAALPAEGASYGDIAKAYNGVLNHSENADYIASIVSRFVKQQAADTTLENAKRDKAEFAWIPSGDACAYCLMLASQGWQPIRSDTHAEHIHPNCNCEYAVRFNKDFNVSGYNPEALRKEYDEAEGSTPNEKMRYIRRQQYAENADEINAQKREAYAERND